MKPFPLAGKYPQDVLAKLAAKRGYDVGEASAEEVALFEQETGIELHLIHVEGWLIIRAFCFETEEMRDPSVAALLRSVALLHDRLIGCRFSLDEAGTFWLVSDLPLKHSNLGYVFDAVDQACFILETTLGVLEETAKDGVGLDDKGIDALFRLVDTCH